MSEQSYFSGRSLTESRIITILIADDHPILRRALRSLLEKEEDFKIIAEAGDGEEAIALADELAPDMIIMDIGMPKVNGLEATRRIKAAHPDIAILVLTVHDDAEYIFGILEAGAAGYIIKSEFDEQILQAIRGVAAGDTVLSSPITTQLLKYVMKHRVRQPEVQPVQQLNSREREILRLAARGLSNKDISEELSVSVHTVKSNLMDIFTKLEAASRTEAVMKGLLAGYISLDDVG